MVKPLLTIGIPSYNRLDKAQKCVTSLLAQIKGRPVDIVVLDNGSRQNYLEAFADKPVFRTAIDRGSLKVLRNVSNIGMSANIMRAFEIAEGSWLWLLSDDDEIRPDALATILTTIEAHAEKCGFIKFSSIRSRPDHNHIRLQSLEEFVDFCAVSTDAFNGFLFISNGLYRLADFRPLLKIGFYYANTYIPHFMMLTAYMAHGNCCVISRKEVVDYVIPEVGYNYGMVAGLGVGAPKHLLLTLSPYYYKKYLRLFFPHKDFKVIIDLFFQCRHVAAPYVCGHLVGTYLSYVSIARSFPKMLVLRCFGLLVRFPSIFEYLVFLAERMSPIVRKHVAEMKKRYEIVPEVETPR